MTVDEILATGQYTDRRGRVWTKCPVHPTELNDCWWAYGKPVPRNFEHKPESAIRLLIERDQHQDECPSLIACENHPVPCVTIAGGPYGCFHVNPADTSDETYVAHECTHEGAMDAARALAVGE